MIPNPELIHYLCIARSDTILGQHQNDKEPNMEALAAQCVAQAPPNHSLYSHTVNNRTFTFLVDPPFLLFSISDHTLLKSQTLPFLHRIITSFRQTLPSNHRFAPLSFQPQFHSIFLNALQFNPNNNLNLNLVPQHPQQQQQQQQQQSVPSPQGLKKKKRPNDSPAAMLDVSDDVVSLPPLLKPHPIDHHRHNKAKHVWKKHVWVLLLLDLFVCAVLFVIWLWVCNGFKCMTY